MSSRPGIMFMPHGNLQYSQLPPDRRSWVVHQSYESIFDIAEEMGVRIAFEASGQTLELIAAECPEVLEKLNRAIQAGRIEPVASPHTHIMLSNVSPELGLNSLIDGLDTWERITGVRPVTGWNPECSWTSYIPDIYREAGFEVLIADADSYLLSTIPWLRDVTGLAYDVRGHSNKSALFRIEAAIEGKADIIRRLNLPHRLPNGLNVILRSDMMCNILLWYLMGATEGNREEPIRLDEVRDLLIRWRDRVEGGDGFIMPYAEDAEYVGTTAYFYVKQFGLARFFEPAPDSIVRFREILSLSQELGFDFITPCEAIGRYQSIPGEGFDQIENGTAWHGGTAKAWANTPYSRILDPVCASIYDGLQVVAKEIGLTDPREDARVRQILTDITTAYVSDARWPPAPTSPGRFNVREAIEALKSANKRMSVLMRTQGIEKKLGIYSPRLMKTQIEAIEEELMQLDYFGE